MKIILFQDMSENNSGSTTRKDPSNIKKRKTQSLCPDTVLNMAHKTLNEPEELAVFGRHVANKLHNMPEPQK